MGCYYQGMTLTYIGMGLSNNILASCLHAHIEHHKASSKMFATKSVEISNIFAYLRIDDPGLPIACDCISYNTIKHGMSLILISHCYGIMIGS